jgi:hypothetical protein
MPIYIIKFNFIKLLAMKKIFLISSFLLAGLCNSTFAQAKHEAAKPTVVVSEKAGWHTIASTDVELNTDSDAVAIYGMDKFKALRVKATKEGVHIKTMRVYFENGTEDLLDVNSDLKAGETSKDFAIDSSKPLKKVTYIYNTVPNKRKEKARLELFGLK